MSNWRPSTGADVAKQRAELLARTRAYFDEHAVLGVDTPALGETSVTDPNIESLRVTEGWYLQTSPEYHLKRLLAAGYPDIYSIARVFRGGEKGRRHLPEFTMVEWYRLGLNLDAIIADTLALIASVLQQAKLQIDASRDNYAELFATHLGLDAFSANCEELADAAAADDGLRTSLGDDRDAWLDLLMATKIATSFAPDSLHVVAHYPASQAALARLCPEDSRVADRFEIFFGHLELANGYVELRDADEQAQRMDTDLAVRNARGLPAVPRDSKLLAALQSGLPACAGVALGFERLHMVAAGVDDIRNVVSFS